MATSLRSTVFWDIETFSQVSLKEHGARIYAKHVSAGVWFLCYAIDNGGVQIWRPGDSVPEVFANPDVHEFVSHNWTFENAILEHKLIPLHGFAPISREQQHYTERLALSNAYPAELGLCCEALGLPWRKDPEARKAMLRLSRPQTAKKRKKPADPAQQERDLALLRERCKRDVEATRAVHRSQQLRQLLPQERELLLLDARINARGIQANAPFLEAVRKLAIEERNNVNVRLDELTKGVVTSVDQVARIKKLINDRGRELTTLGKRSVAAALAHKPDAYVTELLRLRQQGAYASVRMAKRLLGHADPDDGRIRDALRIYGAGPGRWSSPGPQLQNLRRNDSQYPAALVEALVAGRADELARYGSPLAVAAELSRAALCARDGHVLRCLDLASIESRLLAWYAGEIWKLDTYQQYDATGDKTIEPYRVVAARMLGKDVRAIDAADRQKGKAADLACGYGGALGAWRRIAGNDGRSDAEVLADVKQWRLAHPAIVKFWRELATAIRVAIRIGRPVSVGTQPQVIAAFDGQNLTLTLPSERAINYPGARLVPNTKFEDGDPDVEFFDNARGNWRRVRGWYGIFVENVIQATARDLLAAALLRFDARGYPIVFHCHDEVVIEAPENADADLLGLLIEPPAWAAGLPLNGTVHSGRLYLAEPDASATPRQPLEPEQPQSECEIEREIDAFVASAERLPATKAIERGAEDEYLISLDETAAPLTDLVSLPMDSANRVSCPFHDDPNPSCSIYPDHWYCHACGARGTRLDWLRDVEGMSQTEAVNALQDWHGCAAPAREASTDQEKLDFALSWWDTAQPLLGSIGERYLAETRGIDTNKLPPEIHEALRFHPRCVFGAGERHPCIIALMRDPLTDLPVGIHRIGLAQSAKPHGAVTKLDRRALGRMGVVKLWPLNGAGRLVVGEGIETVLAAATRMTFRCAPLTPAWSVISKHGLAALPAIPGAQRLIQLVDHDENGEGQKAAERGRQVWSSGAAVPLVPKQAGWDFNDVILKRKA
jgi:DNA polymerase